MIHRKTNLINSTYKINYSLTFYKTVVKNSQEIADYSHNVSNKYIQMTNINIWKCTYSILVSIF